MTNVQNNGTRGDAAEAQAEQKKGAHKSGKTETKGKGHGKSGYGKSKGFGKPHDKAYGKNGKGYGKFDKGYGKHK